MSLVRKGERSDSPIPILENWKPFVLRKFKKETTMVINLIRYKFLENKTLGMMFINGKFECHTLEDKVRDVKVYGKTAIPKGQYKLIVTMSNRFKKEMPLLLDVVNFSGVRIHAGNTELDTDGCILTGTYLTTKDTLYKSRVAWDKLMEKIMREHRMKHNMILNIIDIQDEI